MIVSERNGGFLQLPSFGRPLDTASMQFFGSASSGPAKAPERTSVPSTRIVCGEASMNGFPSSVLPTPSASFDFWIWAETAKAMKLRAIQARAAIPAHFSARFQSGRSGRSRGVVGGRSPSPLPRRRRSRKPARSGLGIASPSRRRDLYTV